MPSINPNPILWIYNRAASAFMKLAPMFLLGILAIQSAQAQSFAVFYNFAGSPDGAYPYGGLIQDAHGNFYGSSYEGGASNMGTVFKLRRNGSESILRNFTGPRGACPYGGLLRDKAGNLYGTTAEGGASRLGVMFKISSNGKETILHSFTGGADGSYPYGGLVQDAAGNLYGTTETGGAFYYGTIFIVTAGGSEQVLHSFNGSDGAYPTYTSLLLDKDGNLYGVTEGGGASNHGVVYVLPPSGKMIVLHSFTGGKKDGCAPVGTPLMDANGDLFGAAEHCGSFHNGVIWKVSKSGAETLVHNFAGSPADGANPFAGVIMDANGNLYGDTLKGGVKGYGTLFKLSESGKLKLLHSFDGTDGAYPIGGMMRGADGNLYGTAVQGGTLGNGTAFTVSP